MKIEKFSGTDPQLYKLVAPLVMSPGILRQNNNYPFKTSIDNYYISGDNAKLLSQMIDKVVTTFGEDYPIYSVTHTRHVNIFQEKGFSPVKEWKLYVKMEWKGDENNPKECI